MNETQKRDFNSGEETQKDDAEPIEPEVEHRLSGSKTFEEALQDAEAGPKETEKGFKPSLSEEKMHIERLENELEKTKDQLLRAMAETENLRRRAVKERQDAGKYAVSGFARDLLSVADNLRRALEAIPANMPQIDEQFKNILSGVEATERELLSVFERSGIKKLEPMNEVFDPNLHEVMFEAPVPGLPAGTIFQLVEPGYTIHDRLLRPARVGVVKDTGNGSGTDHDDLPPEPGRNLDTQV
ncbi:MAG: nucleotide exchange factor GrpE [Alphaproteobacteria bacterium]|nr:nucleotide exchange factor GrpE [Alphaproteobacteria bacterium]MCB9975851.1 nucleotide exchange factor GrpE [Rhodospirillales bacterium]